LKNNIATDLLKAFLGNGWINTFQPARVGDVYQWTNVTAGKRANELAG
jgi:hypothetical protein